MEYLLFRLYGPMSAWGEAAVGEYRPSAERPSRSAVFGMLAAALGIRREEEARLLEFNQTYRHAVCLDSAGELLSDFHTAQVPPSRRGVIHRTRRDELRAEKLNTIISRRDYRMDLFCTVAIWTASADAGLALDDLGEALRRPLFPLYLGRKSCPLALPLSPQRVNAESLYHAFEQVRFPKDELIDELIDEIPLSSNRTFYWDDHPKPGMEADARLERDDELLSRARWQFSPRREYRYSEQRGGGC